MGGKEMREKFGKWKEKKEKRFGKWEKEEISGSREDQQQPKNEVKSKKS